MKVIKAFDLVGDENNCNSLWKFEKEIILIKKILSKNNLNIPFLFHAGETKNINKSLSNIKFAIKYGGNRIGHGFQVYNDDNLINQIIKKNILLEICPISNIKLNNISDISIYYKLYKKGVKMSINTDDPNKLNDCTINDNYKILLNNGFNLNDLKILKHYSKLFSYK